MRDPPPSVDPGGVRAAAALAIGPAAFLGHFSAVYGFHALACAFGWRAPADWPIGLVQAFVLVATAIAVLAVLVVARRIPDRPTAGAAHREYDQVARGEFVGRFAPVVRERD